MTGRDSARCQERKYAYRKCDREKEQACWELSSFDHDRQWKRGHANQYPRDQDQSDKHGSNVVGAIHEQRGELVGGDQHASDNERQCDIFDLATPARNHHGKDKNEKYQRPCERLSLVPITGSGHQERHGRDLTAERSPQR